MEPRKMGPLPAGSHMLRETCPGCHRPFMTGESVTLVVIGPGDDPEKRAKCAAGRFYTAVAIPAHWACVTGLED